MKIRATLLTLSFSLLGASLSGCGEPPEPVSAPGSTAAGQLPAGHAPIDGVPKPQPGEETHLAGTILLEGAGFDQPGRMLYVSVRLKGMRAPWLSRKYDLSRAPLPADEAGRKRVAFDMRTPDPTRETFNANGFHVPPAGQEWEVYACFKSGPMVEDKTLTDAAVPFVTGKTDYELTLKLP